MAEATLSSTSQDCLEGSRKPTAGPTSGAPTQEAGRSPREPPLHGGKNQELGKMEARDKAPGSGKGGRGVTHPQAPPHLA